MGNPKQKWTSDEEEALRAGVAKHGPGKWKLIQKDPDFNRFLHSRSNIDLKDKWRNMSAAVQGFRDKSRTPRPKPSPDALAISSVPVQSPTISPVPVVLDSPADQVKDDSGKDIPDAKNGSRINDMILEAIKEQHGMDIGSIQTHLEKISDVPIPHNFRKQLGARLRRLIQQEKLEKVDSQYRINNFKREKNANSNKGILAKQQLDDLYEMYSDSRELLEEAAKTAAYKVVEAEEKSSLVADAAKDMEKFSKMAEETDSVLLLAREILDRCTYGEIVLAA